MVVRDRAIADRVADRRVDPGHRSDSVEQGTDVEAGAADEDRQAALAVDAGDFSARPCCPVGRGAGVGTVANTIKTVIGSGAIIRRWRGGEDR